MLNRISLQGYAHCVVFDEVSDTLRFNLTFKQGSLPEGIIQIRSHKLEYRKLYLEDRFVEVAGELIALDGHIFVEAYFVGNNVGGQARKKFKPQEAHCDSETTHATNHGT